MELGLARFNYVAELRPRNQDIVASKAASVVVVGGGLNYDLTNLLLITLSPHSRTYLVLLSY